jgi:hypothetical protein
LHVPVAAAGAVQRVLPLRRDAILHSQRRR